MKETIKYLRETNKYSQTELAAHLGISRQMYIKYENGEVEPSVSVVKKLCQLYKVDYSIIIDNKFKELYYIEHDVECNVAENTEKANSIKKAVYSNLPKNDSKMIVSEPAVSYKANAAVKSLVSKSYDIAYAEARKLKYDELFKLLSAIVKLMEEEKEKPKLKTMTREESLAFFEEFSGCIKNPDLANVDYKELLYEALDEKYGMNENEIKNKDGKNGSK